MDPRRPVIPIGVEEDEGHTLVLRSGEQRAAQKLILDPEDVGRIWTGYVCAQCLETQERPFPKACWVCGFPMDERQLEYLGKAYQGNERVGPSSSIRDELAALDELEARQKRSQTISVPQIIVPRGF